MSILLRQLSLNVLSFNTVMIYFDELSKNGLRSMTYVDIINCVDIKAYKSNLEFHRVILSFFHWTLCVRRCTSPATIPTLVRRLEMTGNDRLTA